MTLIEKEAKNKLCVHWANSDNYLNCAGQECMAWTWVDDYETDQNGLGYCGLVHRD